MNTLVSGLSIVDAAQVLGTVLAAWTIFRAYRHFAREDPARFAWALLGVGMLCGVVATVWFLWFDVVAGQPPYPSVADIFATAAYFPIAAALFIQLRMLRASGLPVRIPWVLSGLLTTVLLCLFACLWWPIVTSTDVGVGEKVLALLYPAADLLIFLAAATIFSVIGQLNDGLFGRPWRCLALAALILVTADLTWITLEWQNATEYLYLPSALYVLYYAAMAWSGLEQSRLMRQVGERTRGM